MSSPRTAVLLAFACKLQYHVLRATQAAGYDVHVLGRDCARGLRYSRFCSGFHRLDFDPASQPAEAALPEINSWLERLSADVVLPSDILSTRLLATLAGRLLVPSCALPQPDCLDELNDKWRFYQFCRAHGATVPETWLFPSRERLREAIENGTVALPLVVKPTDSMGGRGILHVTGECDLKRLESLQYQPVLAQKFVAGRDIDIMFAADRGLIGTYAIQRKTGGTYAFVRHDGLLDEAARLAEASAFHGIAHFDGIEESATGKVYLLECNPRFWFSIFAATIAGLNFVTASLETKAADPGGPRTIAGREVHIGRALFKELLKKRRIGEIDRGVIAYNLADPIGRLCCQLGMFDDNPMRRSFVSRSGLIDDQVAALAAMRLASPARG